MAVKLERLGGGEFSGGGEFGLNREFGSRSRAASLSDILGPDKARLARQQQSLGRLGAEAEVLGLKDTEGRGPVSLLTGALDYFTRPQSAVLGFLTGLTGRGVQPGEQQGALQRFAAGLSGSERYTGGKLLGPTPENANIVQRLARGVTGFGIDVATDPLNLLTFGGGGVLRGAARAAVTEAEVGREAARIFKPAVSEVPLTRPVGAETATSAASENALQRAARLREEPKPVTSLTTPTTATQAPTIDSALKTTKVTEDIAPLATVEPLTDRIARAAGEGQALRGPRGARDAIQRTLLDEGYELADADRITRDIIQGTSGEVRGGIRIRLPFLGLDSNGKVVGVNESVTRTVADITPGAGYLTDSLGLRSVADASRDLFNAYRSKKFYQGWSKLMNGRFGAEYANFIRNSYEGKQGGMDYKTFRDDYAKDNLRTAALTLRDENASRIILTADKMIKESENPDEVFKAAEKFGQMSDDMYTVDDSLLNPIDKLGLEVAIILKDHGENMFRNELLEAAGRAGVQVGDISEFARNYISRPLTREEILRRMAKGKRTAEFDAIESRRLGYDTDEFGRLVAVSNEELNRRYVAAGLRKEGEKVFETDPLKIAAQQYASYSEMITHLNLIADIKATGKLKEATLDTIRLLNLPKLVARGGKFQDTLTTVSERMTNALQLAIDNNDFAQIEKIKNAINKIAADKNTITSLLANVQDMSPDSLKVIGNLTKVMRSALAEGERAGIVLTKNQKAKLFNANGLIQIRESGGNVQELIDAGLVPLGLDPNVKLPRGLSNLYAEESVRDAVEKYFKIQTGGFTNQKWFNDVYAPYYTLFKMFATVGRPGGYHLRNLQGAWWNNYLGDVSGSDHKLSASVLSEIKKTQTEAENAIAAIREGKPSGLSPEADNLAKFAVQLGKERGTDVVDIEVSQLADYILSEKLSKFKIGDYNAFEILQSARDNNLMRGSRRLEYLRSEARASGTELADALADPKYVNLFKGVSKDELTKYQEIMNKAANLGYINASGEVADLSENYVRLAAFISGARRFGLTDNGTAAGYLAKALQFDYADLSDFERTYMKNILPFYTWTRRNLPLQLSALFNNPGKFNKLDFATEELQTQFQAEGDDAFMADMVPDWMREKMGFVTSIATAGGPLAISGPGFESPAFDLNRYLQIGRPGEVRDKILTEIVSASNPVTKSLVEYLTDIDTFTGGRFGEEGVDSPFGSIPIPGLTFIGADGKNKVAEKEYNILKDIVPPLGMIARLASPGDADRRLSTWLSTFAGAPVSTLTTGQATAELRARDERLRTKVEKTYGMLGVDKEWVRMMIEEGATESQIRQYIAAGYGKIQRPATEE